MTSPRPDTRAAPVVTFADKIRNDAHARRIMAMVEQGDPRVNLDLDDAAYERAVRAWECGNCSGREHLTDERTTRGGAA